MKQKQNIQNIPPAYEGVEHHLMALYYSGVYITNADIVQVGKLIECDLPMKDRLSSLKSLMNHAHETKQMAAMLQGFVQIINKRIEIYSSLGNDFEQARPLIRGWIQKAKATILLLQREMRSNPYE